MDKKNQPRVIIIIFLLMGMAAFHLNPLPTDLTSPGSEPSVVEGLVNITILPVEFPDATPVTSIENLTRLVNENMSQYFFDQSYGKLWIEGSALDWVHVSKTSDYYRTNWKELRNTVLSKITWTSSNFTEHIIIVYSGNRTIRPHHAGAKHGAEIIVDGQEIPCEVSVVPELRSFPSWLHEMGHGLGLEDYYCDDNYQNTHLGKFIGSYALMADSTYNQGPSDICGYSKVLLGWIPQEEILDVIENTTCSLLAINEGGQGHRILRIQIDEWKHYLIEARTNRGLDSGILITSVDISRKEGGFGRVEVARSFRSLNNYFCYGSTFRLNESFIDGDNGIRVDVISNSSIGYTVQVKLGNFDSPRTLTSNLALGSFLSTTSLTTRNGTNYVAICALNTTTNLRRIHLFNFDTSLSYILSSPLANDSFNPTLVEGRNNIALIYEIEYQQHHRVVGQSGNEVNILSGFDDARNPTAACSHNFLWIAYENWSLSNCKIVLRTGSLGWYDTVSLFGSVEVIESSNTTICKAPMFEEEPVILSYINSSLNENTLEILWGFDLWPGGRFRIPCNDIESFHVSTMQRFWMFVSIEKRVPEFSSITETYLINIYEDECHLIDSRLGTLTDSEAMMGLWHSNELNNEIRITRIWNRHRESDASYQWELGESILVAFGMCSVFRSPAVYYMTTENNSVFIKYRFVTSLPLISSDVKEQYFSYWATLPTLGLLFAVMTCIWTDDNKP